MDFGNIDPNVVEKIERLSDILMEFGHLALLKKHLSLYGGTALNFLHLSDIPRLSEDLDFNYRHFGVEDWGVIRSEIDEMIKRVLDKLGYSPGEIKIQSIYNLMRFHIHYLSRLNKRDAIKIEIGYTRRLPIFDPDNHLPFKHPVKGIKTDVLTPQREELYANKVCTLLSRGMLGQFPRDIFDVSIISERDFDHPKFIDAMMIEALLSDLDIERRELKPPDRSLYSRLSRLLMKEYDLEEVFSKANGFIGGVIKEIGERSWPEFQRVFLDSGKIDLRFLREPSHINPNIESHPQLLWLRQKAKTNGSIGI